MARFAETCIQLSHSQHPPLESISRFAFQPRGSDLTVACLPGHAPGHAGAPGKLAAEIADEAYFQYVRALQKEEDAELTIHVPPAVDGQALEAVPSATTENGTTANGHAADGELGEGAMAEDGHGMANGALPAGAVNGSDAALMPPPPTPGSGAHAAGGGPRSASGSRTVLVRVEYDVRDPVSGVRFLGDFAMSDSQARFCDALWPRALHARATYSMNCKHFHWRRTRQAFLQRWLAHSHQLLIASCFLS